MDYLAVYTAISRLVQCLKIINQPVTIESMVNICGVASMASKDLKEKLIELLDTAVDRGLAIKFNNHYIASTHVEDILPLLGDDPSSSQSIVNTSKEQDDVYFHDFIAALGSLISLTGDEKSLDSSETEDDN